MRAGRRAVWGLPWWDGRIRSLALDVAVAAGTIVFDLVGAHQSGPLDLGSAASCVAGAALLVRRRFPFPVLLVAAASLTAGGSVVALTVALYTLAARRGVSVVTAVGAVATAVASLVFQAGISPIDLTTVVAILGLSVLAPVLAGLWKYQRAALVAVLRERAEDAERTRTLLAEQAVSAERRRIAREMHDVVAHRVTAIALQAGALSLHAQDEHTSRFAETIRTVSVAALDELRDILRVLRDAAPDGDAPSTPGGVGLHAAIRGLVEEVVASGAQVELALPDRLPEVSDQVERAVYRVVQESLTNAGKHAPGAPVTVTVRPTTSALVVEVTNPRTPQRVSVPGSGYGLIGMRERVELAGGTLRADQDGDTAAFRVVAEFPLKPTDERDTA
jgi:signal transduction histidine kinase